MNYLDVWDEARQLCAKERAELILLLQNSLLQNMKHQSEELFKAMGSEHVKLDSAERPDSSKFLQLMKVRGGAGHSHLEVLEIDYKGDQRWKSVSHLTDLDLADLLEDVRTTRFSAFSARREGKVVV